MCESGGAGRLLFRLLFRLLLPGAAAPMCGPFNGCRFMPAVVSEPARQPRFSRPILIVAAGMGVLLGGTLVLWAKYGAAVFFDMVAAGIAACL